MEICNLNHARTLSEIM